METKRCLFITALLFFILSGVSCTKERMDDTAEEIKPIELSGRILRVDNIQTSDSIYILEGNGDYSITIKSFYIDNDKYENVPFENHTHVYIEGNKIIAKRLSSETFIMQAVCILTDSKGIKKTFIIENQGMLGIHDFFD